MIALDKSASPYNRYNRTKEKTNACWQEANITSSHDALVQSNESLK